MRRFMNWGWIIVYTILLVVTVIFITVKEEDSPVDDTTTEKITLTFRHFWILEHDRHVLDIFEDVVQTYQLSHPNVKVNFDGMDQTVHREQKLKSEMVIGSPPDMFVLFGGAEIEPYIRANRLMDLTDFINDNHLKNQFKDLQLWTSNEKVYGLPIEGNAEPLYVNSTIFESLGLQIPRTLSELNEAIVVLKQNGYIPFALGNKERWPAGIFAHYLMDRFSNSDLINQLVQGEENIAFQNEDYLRAFNQLELWINDDVFGPSPNELSTEDAVHLFTHGKAAMYLNGNWDITLFNNDDAPKDFQNEVTVIPFPSLYAAEGTRSMAGGYTIGIGLSSNLSDAKKEAALELMQAFYTEEVQTRIVYEGLRIPSMWIRFDPEKTGPIFTQMIQLMEESSISFVPYDNLLSPEVKRSFLRVIEEMIDGKNTAKEALDQLDDASNQYWSLRRNTLSK
ncbi:ABC transporter substrate-binding protein [Paenibacillus crassostreae]|uniref:ABC transporter substrate-binding protein n=1 Tax=Paenibacillus crassostreae TaxID=1763538 RepID=A0A167EUG7_9BACL|nr:extracellular solute-binding protein [Paenibacillus crassostreae]AOZ93455.1 ABC transporter substrate-binding protein [Paenibacillus crassostreae]OAB75890.1 ABC transporter substrate-binding protein [Paenibacillus crassostreae]